MSSDEALHKFGLPAVQQYREEIRQLLVREIERENNGESGEEMLRTLALQLFSIGFPEDAILIWNAKQSSFDAGCGLDVQFLCGAGLAVTKAFLANSKEPSATAALNYLEHCEKAGDFKGWTPQQTLEQYQTYYAINKFQEGLS